MKRIKLTIAYDGTGYNGWQIQPGAVTIEGTLNRYISELMKEDIKIIGASRTDSGVHALGNVAVFDTENRMPPDKICYALNQRLPDDIRIQKSEEVAIDWHPRKNNCTKTYEYKIFNRRISSPIYRLYSHFCYHNIDLENMKKGAAYLLGEHDFSSFCNTKTEINKSQNGKVNTSDTVRTIYSIDIMRSEDDMITIRISGNGFLYNMVRIIAGTLIYAGMGVYPPEHIKEILDMRDRTKAGPKISACGLTLISLDYDKNIRTEIVSCNEHWNYILDQTEVETKKRAYLTVKRCETEEYERLLTKIINQAYRNGAVHIYVTDSENIERLYEGREFGYYKLYGMKKASDIVWFIAENAGNI